MFDCISKLTRYFQEAAREAIDTFYTCIIWWQGFVFVQRWPRYAAEYVK